MVITTAGAIASVEDVIPFPSPDSASPIGRIGRRERLGGVLSFYERNVA